MLLLNAVDLIVLRSDVVCIPYFGSRLIVTDARYIDLQSVASLHRRVSPS